jgi:lipopolysaccharide export system permease protein
MRPVFPRKATQYMFFEMWPSLLMGLAVFIFILMMFQMLRYTEFVLIHGVGLEVVIELLAYIAISFLPALFPMSLLFAVLLTYGRLSQDSEIVALKAAGLGPWSLLFPAFLLSLIVSIFFSANKFSFSALGQSTIRIINNQAGTNKSWLYYS